MIEGIETLGINLTDKMHEQLNQMLDVLNIWRVKHNLTSLTDRREQEIYHVLDSLSAHQYFTQHESILDVGTGAGFPGIPLAIIYPEKQFHLIDSNGKKIAYLRLLVSTLGLENVSLYHDRMENINIEVSAITSRAVSSPDKLKAMTNHLNPKSYILYVGPNCIYPDGSLKKVIVPGSTKSHSILEITT